VVKEGFSPALVETAIEYEGCERGDIVLDPFAGSGTVPVVAGLKGIESMSFENNPFLAFAARVKCSNPRAKELREGMIIVDSGITASMDSPLRAYSTFCRTGDVRGLFNEDVLLGVAGGMNASSAMMPPVRDAARLALLSAAMECCNATRDGKALRYRDSLLNANYTRDDLKEAFRRNMDRIISDVGNKITEIPRIRRADVRREFHRLSRPFKLCVTSPPYLNSFDYSDVYRPELFLGGFVKDNSQLRKIRLDAVRSHLQASWRKPRTHDFGDHFELSWRSLLSHSDNLWDRRIPMMIQAYFEDMSRVFRNLRSRADQGAAVWLVVSTSAYAGVEVPVDLILADVATRAGWKLRDIHVIRHMRSSGQHWRNHGTKGAKDEAKPPLRESLIILDNPSKV